MQHYQPIDVGVGPKRCLVQLRQGALTGEWRRVSSFLVLFSVVVSNVADLIFDAIIEPESRL